MEAEQLNAIAYQLTDLDSRSDRIAEVSQTGFQANTSERTDPADGGPRYLGR